VELAKVWIGRGGLAEAEALLRKAISLNQADEPSHVELARVLWLDGRPDEAVALLRDFLSRNDHDVALYTLGCLLVAEGKRPEAKAALEQYRRTYGSNHWAQTLQRLIAAGPAGQEEMRSHLRQPRHHEVSGPSVAWDGEAAERSLAAERGGLPRLQRISRVGQADLRFGLGEAGQPEALRLVDAALADDPADAYAQVVKGLALPEYREAMRGRTGRFVGSLPVRLALSPIDAAAEHWQELARQFPEGRHLTHLVQLARGQGDDSTPEALTAWCCEPTRWDNAWESYLKETLQHHLHGDETLVDLTTLAHDALTQAVDVGLDAAPLAA
jgi:tetratricopeptide (TPR) repeat protein